MKTQPPTPNRQTHDPHFHISAVQDLPFDKLVIPDYQRPYKWKVKNVGQMIGDILAFRDQPSYRLGTLVLNRKDGNLEIVDGQQRMVTLALILLALKATKNRQYFKLKQDIDKFCKRIFPSSARERRNVKDNYRAICYRSNELEEVIDFICRQCEFVVVELDDISEAFQFFDSQNSRGKDLEPHDLLKAYHMREMPAPQRSQSDAANITRWQSTKIEPLRNLFLTLYRAKRWPLGLSARTFSKDDIDAFKGVSLTDGPFFPFTDLERTAHYFLKNCLASLPDEKKKDFQGFPFNILDDIINGSRFFELVLHYNDLTAKVTDEATFASYPRAKEVLHTLNTYPSRNRDGDEYVRQMFNTLLLVYVDRFGFIELDSVVPRLFTACYYYRLLNQAVQLATIDNAATDEASMFRLVCRAKTPAEVINACPPDLPEEDMRGIKCEEIKELYFKFNKRYRGDD